MKMIGKETYIANGDQLGPEKGNNHILW